MSHTVTTWTEDLCPTEIEVVVEYDFTAAEPEVNYPETLAFVGALVMETGGYILDQDQIEQWAERWLNGDGYEKAVSNVCRLHEGV